MTFVTYRKATNGFSEEKTRTPKTPIDQVTAWTVSGPYRTLCKTARNHRRPLPMLTPRARKQLDKGILPKNDIKPICSG